MEMSGYGLIAVSGETWDGIARMVYGDESFAAELISANPALSGTMVFTGGERLALPKVQPRISSALPRTAPWRAGN